MTQEGWLPGPAMIHDHPNQFIHFDTWMFNVLDNALGVNLFVSVLLCFFDVFVFSMGSLLDTYI